MSGDLRAARKGYVDLVREHASSTLVMYAMFGFGEPGLAEAKDSGSDATKIELALANFRFIAQWLRRFTRFVATKSDVQTSPLYPWALLRAGQLATLAHDDASAAAAFGELTTKIRRFSRGGTNARACH